MVIQVLPSHVSDQIAAGEVVERPASVIKELVENSIDAGARNIEVRIEAGGKKTLEVIDDGIGMSPEDAEKCVLRHATSKIQIIDDLFAVQSFGFRGEALAAIAAVSRFELITRSKEASSGTKIVIEGGEKKSVEPVSANVGTRIRITDLFFSTPARLAYLKTDETEYRAIVKEILHAALAYPSIGFRLIKDGVNKLDYSSVTEPKTRALQVLKELFRDMIPLNIENSEITAYGFLSSPGNCIRSKHHQYIFVNGRPIQDFKLNYAIREAYVKSCGIEKHLHPVFLLFLEMDPILVDVNVHPRKQEVKFSEPQAVFSLVQRGVIAALEKHSVSELNTSSVVTFPKDGMRKLPSRSNSLEVSSRLFPSFSEQNKSREYQFSPSSFQSITQENPSKDILDEITSLTLVGQVGRRYIVAESEQGVIFFDQHALHERQRFEQFWNEYKARKQTIQKLLAPYQIELSEAEVSLLYEHKTFLHTLHFEVTFPKDQILEVHSIPQILVAEDLDGVFQELLEYFTNNQVGEHSIDRLMRKVLEYKSCRGAVMYGDKLEKIEMQQLLDDFLKTKWRNLCPHGRPNHVFFSFADLDKKFHR